MVALPHPGYRLPHVGSRPFLSQQEFSSEVGGEAADGKTLGQPQAAPGRGDRVSAVPLSLLAFRTTAS